MTEDSKPENSLYPFLPEYTGGATQASDLAQSIQRKCEESAAVQQRFFEENAQGLIACAKTLAEVFNRGGKLLCIGNGGSACDAAHLAVEFSHPVTTGRRALPALNLCSDPALITALANDAGFAQIFRRQIDVLGDKGDALFLLSTSGNSSNLLEAVEIARQGGLASIALLGGDGGLLAQSEALQHCLIVPSDSVHRIQESHVLCYHILWDLVHTLMAQGS